MSAISGPGPVLPPHEPRGNPPLGQAIESYAKLLAHPNPTNPHDLETIAKKTVELSKLAHSVMHAASTAIRSTAGDLDKLLLAPISNEVSILKASEHYLENPANVELGDLVQELCNNSLALGLMCNELALLSGSIKNPNALGG